MLDIVKYWGFSLCLCRSPHNDGYISVVRLEAVGITGIARLAGSNSCFSRAHALQSAGLLFHPSFSLPLSHLLPRSLSELLQKMTSCFGREQQLWGLQCSGHTMFLWDLFLAVMWRLTNGAGGAHSCRTETEIRGGGGGKESGSGGRSQRKKAEGLGPCLGFCVRNHFFWI